MQSYGLYILSTIYRNSELSTTGGLMWASVRVYLELLRKEDNRVETIKNHWPYSDLVTIGEQEPGQKGNMRWIAASVNYDTITEKIFKVMYKLGIKLNCWRSNNFGLTSTLSRGQLLLDNFVRCTMYISVTTVSKDKALHKALWTGYERLSIFISTVRYATGEVSTFAKERWDGRGFVVPCKVGRDLNTWQTFPFRNEQIRSYATRRGRKESVPVVELNKDFNILAKHWRVIYNNPDKPFKDLRGLLKLDSLWFTSYLKIRRNKGANTAGPDTGTINELTKKRILEIKDIVMKGEYEWIGTREVLIPKPGKPGKTRPLGIPAINDRLVQETIKTIIEPIFELSFNNQSHGFRPNRSCHTALKWVNTHMKECSWFIEGDIKSYFPTVNHGILMSMIEEKVKDKNILKLIRTGLKAKVFDKDKKFYEPELGTGGILSPLLSNIYLNEFDKYMEKLITECNTAESKPRRNPAIDKLYKSQDKSEIYKARVPYLHPKDTGHIRVRYIRYADDFIIAINGSRELASSIKSRITDWLKDKLKLELSQEKTLITHISEGIKFLGYVIKRRTAFTKQTYGNRRLTRRMSIPTLDINKDRVIAKLSAAGYCDKSGRPLPNFKLLQLPQSETNLKVNYILQGLANWWSIAGNRKSTIWYVNYILRMSIAKMYAAKFKLKTTKAVYKIAGNDLGKPIGNRSKSIIGVKEGVTNKLQGIKYSKYNTIPNNTGNKISKYWKPRYMELLDKAESDNELIKEIWTQGISKNTNPLSSLAGRMQYVLSSQGSPCAVCGSTEDVQMHHTKPMKNIKETDALKRHIVAINIKQIPLCRKHHLEAHQGDWRKDPIPME